MIFGHPVVKVAVRAKIAPFVPNLFFVPSFILL